ncbi:uroporphyrinogen-III C-methyltransferase [Solemya pervernicosa gill symbiont]|uniref:Siroheme synthase n=2 Tax=Gammaproteobacteria incertae sedis TaxID=118884 RepID=A0A1T2L6K4_9GAMM|nr:siroheme synthase CysG [Candidatus Reidiella endopervernicosa]OOZ40680.1 uroporphyrinogen-III C-methyltransferase [Solemya pervernicosa gill symbiont]QKQ26744.1 uroporphyrinogen-III C-methyltransferase [Candidatus Reidiella endopervernicosa]
MDFLPIFMNLKGRSCLVVGGGEVASRKASLLLDAGADLTVVAPELANTLQAWANSGRVKHREAGFEASDLEDVVLVIAATDDEAVNRQVSELAQARALPVNVVDNPSLCTFVMPSIIDRSPVQIAVSTGGVSPVLARLLRARLESLIPSAYGRLASMVEGFRDAVKGRFDDVNSRRGFWEGVLQGRVAELVFAGKDDAARRELEASIERGEVEMPGEVYLVGGGPGDPDLLTFRALRLMQQADVVVHDRLVSKEVLDLCRRDAERIYVGKERDNHSVPQDQINQLLVDLAKQGKRICRLKGGDPFVFGRGGEEIDTLTANGVSFQVVPAITAALGASSYAGIPLTHRDYSQSVVFVTGHLKDGSMNLNWKGLAQPQQTIVFYMGLKGLPVICEKLIENGLSPDLPIALVQQATTPRQRVYTGTLSTMPQIIEGTTIKPPTLIIVGDVVRLHERLNWFTSDEEAGEKQ